jgi:hypothetical protein
MKKSVGFFLILPFLIFCFQNKTIAQCWNNGDLLTYDQSAWGDPSTAAASNLNVNFDKVYASTLGVVEAGIPGSSGFSMRFSSPTSVINYLPSVGTPAALNADLLDPTTNASGQFGGDVLALRLNIDFSDSGFLNGNVNTKFGDLVIYGLTSNTDLNGLTVRQFLSIVNTALGGGTTTDPITDLDAITVNINNSFSAGTASTFAQQHLKKGWKNGDFTTYGQVDWATGGTANAILVSNYGTVYAGTAGGFEIGGSGGHTALWTNVSPLSSYLPASGLAAALTANVTNATFTSSGIFGGDIAALKLNIDFSDSGFLTHPAGIHFGDLVLYGLTDLTGLNGTTVREFLTVADTLLGGGTSSYSIDDIDQISNLLNGAFINGSPSAWTQLHLKRGWQNGDLTTYNQVLWSGKTSLTVASSLLEANFNTVYATTFGEMIIGGGFTMTFGSASAIESYLPQSGPAGILDANLSDPTSSASGEFGGEVVELKLNIDFSDAGLLQNNSGLKFGDLTLCSFTTEGDELNGSAIEGDNSSGYLTQSQVNVLNGQTVRQILNEMNIVLGGGTGTLGLTANQLYLLAFNLNASFDLGYPNGIPGGFTQTFTQLHLVNGSCDCGNTVTNQCPTAAAIAISTTVGTATKFILQGSDADNNTLTYSISQNPLHGTATIAGGDSIIYTPTAAYHGTDQLKYKVSDGQCDAEATVNITVIVCPGGQGYWKNNKAAWPVTTLLLGTISYTQAQLMKILNTAVGTGNNADASLILADQLIAAKLSVANGSPAVQHLADSIAAADALIGGNTIPMKVKPSSALGKKMISLATFFANYNNGVFTQGCSAPANITGEQLIADNELTAGNEIVQIPGGFVLEQNHPNPFHGSTIISYGLPANGNTTYHVSLKIYDITGREIRTLVNDEEKAGWKTINFDAGNVAAGIYLYRFSAGKFTVSGKMILIK